MRSLFLLVLFAMMPACVGCDDGDGIPTEDDCDPETSGDNQVISLCGCPDNPASPPGCADNSGEGEGEGDGEEGEGEGEPLQECVLNTECDDGEECTDGECIQIPVEPVCTPGERRVCNTGLDGVCIFGSQRCKEDGSDFDTCEVETSPGELDEVCFDGIDQDCDGRIDNGCACPAGEEADCVLPALDGECRRGRMVCLPDGSEFGECEQVTFFQEEICLNGFDETCDGTADENCVCFPGQTQPCNSGFEGVCAAGVQTCLPDGLGFDSCQPLIAPFTEPETCENGVDEDCDGRPDSGCTCSPDERALCVVVSEVGPCSVGEAVCLPDGNGFGACVQTVLPAATDSCFNLRDDDCDGTVNNGCACEAGTSIVCDTALEGICASGLQTCLADGSGFDICRPVILPFAQADTCGNGVDEDCDGLPDNGCTCDPGDQVDCVVTGLEGACKIGKATCPSDGNAFGACTQTVFPAAQDTCINGIDDDCDAATDETCVCQPFTSRPCATGLPGVCNGGSETCRADGTGFNVCQVLIIPGTQAETCGNGLDDNCNTAVDDGCVVGAGVPGTLAFDDDGDCECEIVAGICSGSINPVCTAVTADDCDDAARVKSSLANEVCGGTEDFDCDGSIGAADPDSVAQCVGTISVSFAAGNFTAVMNGNVTGTTLSEMTTGAATLLGNVLFLEVGANSAGCSFDATSSCGQVAFDPLTDNFVNKALVFAGAIGIPTDFTPRVQTNQTVVTPGTGVVVPEGAFIDLARWGVINGAGGKTCAVLPGGPLGAALTTHCTP